MPLLGDIVSDNVSHIREWVQDDPFLNVMGMPDETKPFLLDGVTDRSLVKATRKGFCGRETPLQSESSKFADLNYLGLAVELLVQQGGNRINRMAHFLDTHGDDRWATICSGHASRTLNALTFVMLHSGLPIVQYGTEPDAASEYCRVGFANG